MRDQIDIFKKWVVYQLKDRHLSVTNNKKGYTFDNGRQHGEILFYPHQLIEEIITEKNEITFYLYYRFIDYRHATQMFQAMMQALQHQEMMISVMVCCSGGLTSSFFVTKMKQYLSLNKIPMKMMAGAVSEIEEMAPQSDLIMVAPQMRYALSGIRKKAAPVRVEAIRPAVFAAYDCHGLYLQIEEIMKE